ncbi:MAG: replication restart helicase PriA [Myxococcota bacterium]
MYASIILKNSLFESFYYRIPDKLIPIIREGFAVYVPLKKSLQIGFVQKIYEHNEFNLPENKIKEIIDIFPINPIFDGRLFNLLIWAAEYYLEPNGSLFFSAIPSGLFRLSNYRLVFEDENNIFKKKIIGLSTIFSRKSRYGITMLDIYEFIQSGRVRLECPDDSVSNENFVVLGDRGKNEEISLELQKVIEKYPNIELLIAELKERKRIPIFEALTILRDKRVFKYLLKVDILKILFQDLFESYSIDEEPIHNLTEEQVITLSKIRVLKEKGFGVHYIYGVTGSGKTEIYLRMADELIREKKSVLFLVPEIALTPQSIFRIRNTLRCDVAVLHSGLSERDRILEYMRIRGGKVNVVVGARSAVFAPLKNLGLVVVDEEHDTAYKQEESPRYNGRDIAIKRAQIENCIVILGSATPSVHSMYNIISGKFESSRLTQRANKKPLPDIEIVSLADREKSGEDVEDIPFFISETLYRAILDTIKNRNKAILMLNRRGFNTILVCTKCGYIFKCPDCDINLVYHKSSNILLCHYCNYQVGYSDICPKCGSLSIRNLGFGTEQVEEVIRRIIPEAKTIRLDRDSVSNLYDLESRISGFSKGDANILIGTQMVAKGHHFPDVTLVGVILADTAFSIPDFRVQERLVQLLMQVSGRAGRGEEKGRVIIQTFNPFDPGILAVKSGNIDEYINIELSRRKNLFYPPFSKIILIRTRSFDENRGVELLNRLKDALVGLNRSEILGPVSSPIARIKREFRHQLLIKTSEVNNVKKILKKVIPDVYRRHPNVRVNIDVDPFNML